jgi:hypothetical protein
VALVVFRGFFRSNAEKSQEEEKEGKECEFIGARRKEPPKATKATMKGSRRSHEQADAPDLSI